MSGSLSNSPAPLSKAPSDRLAALSGRRRAFVFAGLGAIGALGHAPLSWPILTLISLIAMVTLKPWELAPKPAAWAGWAYGTGYFAVTLHWIVEPFLVDIVRHGWMAPFAIALLAGGLALLWGAAFALGSWRQSGLAWAAAFAGAEVVRAHLFTGFPWGMHVTAFVDVMAYQGAAWLGPKGLTLALMLVLVAVASLPRFWGGALAGVLAAFTLSDPPASPEPEADAPLIRVVQPNARQDLKWQRDMIPVFLERKMASTEAEPAADLVLWPEVSVPVWMESADDIFARAAARGQGAELLVGVQSFREGAAYNVLAHINAEGAVAARYDKAHLVPFGEYMPLGTLFSRFGIYGLAANDGFGFATGPGPQIIEIEGVGPVQPLICYESIFAHEVRRAPERPRLIAVATNDAWFGQLGGPAQHLAQSQARAIELGVPVARSANTGISTIIDARGRLVSSLALGEAGHVDAPLPTALPPTVYARLGDLPLAILMLLTLGAHVALRARSVR